MVGKLKSALKRIHWSLACRASAATVIWWALPPAWFVGGAVLLYFYPDWRITKGTLPFSLAVLFAIASPPGVSSSPLYTALYALFLGVLFYVALGVRGLAFIDRPTAYETLSLLAVFGLSLKLVNLIDPWDGPLAPMVAGFFGIAAMLLARGFSAYVAHREPLGASGRNALAALLLGVLVFQAILGILFVPLPPSHKSALAFLFVGVLVESIYGHIAGVLSRRRLLLDVSVFLIFFSIIVGSAPWVV